MFITDTPYADTLIDHLKRSVAFALEEDIGERDITAALIDSDQHSTAQVITREAGILCGREWFDEVFRQVDARIELKWHKEDGDILAENDTLVSISGNSRAILTAERTALNFLQTLSGTATIAGHFAIQVKGSGITVLDTRKTLPGLRLAQKYAVLVGGCQNHRLGLYDMFLIKENHIAGCGGITPAVEKAKVIAPDKRIEVEVETLEQLKEALALPIDVIMLDNFTTLETEQAAKLCRSADGDIKLEASGNMDVDKLNSIKGAVPDYVSIGKLTKHVEALDLSLRLVEQSSVT